MTYKTINESKIEYYSSIEIQKHIKVGDLLLLNTQTLNTLIKNGCWKKWEDLEDTLNNVHISGSVHYDIHKKRYTLSDLDLLFSSEKIISLCCGYKNFYSKLTSDPHSMNYNILAFSFLINKNLYNFFILDDEINLIKSWKKII